MSLKAETAMNIIDALPPKEIARLKSMWLGEEKIEIKKPVKAMTDAQATEYILRLYKRK